MADKGTDLYKLTDHGVIIMGCEGFIDDGTWYMNILGPKAAFVPVDHPFIEVSTEIEMIISNDREANREDLIDHIIISERDAVCLFLEGRLTADVLANATEENGDLVVKMDFGGAPRKIVIKDERGLRELFGTFQANGEPV